MERIFLYRYFRLREMVVSAKKEKGLDHPTPKIR